MPSLIFIFDFDKTVLDNDGDRAVAAQLGVYDQIKQLYHHEKMQWTRIMDRVFSPFTRSAIAAAIEKSFVVQDGMTQLMGQIAGWQCGATALPTGVTSVTLCLCTDANSFFVEHCFKHFFPGTRIDLLYTNPATFEKNDDDHGDPKIRISWCDPNGHSCTRCNENGLPNQCKGQFVKRMIENPPAPDPIIFYAGDGFNDLCALTHLRACDVAFVRSDGKWSFSLEQELLKLPGEAAAKTASASSSSAAAAAPEQEIDPASGGYASPAHENPGGKRSSSSAFDASLAGSASGNDNSVVCSPLLALHVTDRRWRGVCHIQLFRDGNDLMHAAAHQLTTRCADLPPLHLFGDERDSPSSSSSSSSLALPSSAATTVVGSAIIDTTANNTAVPNTFRAYSLRVRIPLCLRQALDSPMLDVKKKLQQDEANSDNGDHPILQQQKVLLLRRRAIEELIDDLENGREVDQHTAMLFPSQQQQRQRQPRPPMSWWDMPWLHGEILIHRRLDRLIRGKLSASAIAAAQTIDFESSSSSSSSASEKQNGRGRACDIIGSLSCGTDERPLSPVADFWAPSKAEAMEHSILFLAETVTKFQSMWDPDQHQQQPQLNQGRMDRECLVAAFQELLMFQLQGNIADLCFRSAADVKTGGMFVPPLVHDDRKELAEFLVDSATTTTINTDDDTGATTATSSSPSSSESDQPSLVDIICDNAGPELTSDLLFAACLLKLANNSNNNNNNSKTSTRCRHHIRFLVKDRPFYVSDTVPHDVDVVIDTFAASDNSVLKRFAQVLTELTRRTSSSSSSSSSSPPLLQIVPVPWSTRACEFRELGVESSIFGYRIPRATNKAEQARLYQQVHSSSFIQGDDAEQQLWTFRPHTRLVIVKGDLNYRRLISDRHWSIHTPFSRAIEDTVFRFLPVAALRTLKCEVLVGVSAEMARKLVVEDGASEDPVKGWRVDGKRGLVAFSRPKGAK